MIRLIDSEYDIVFFNEENFIKCDEKIRFVKSELVYLVSTPTTVHHENEAMNMT